MKLATLVTIATNLPSIVSLIQLGLDKFTALSEIIVEEISEAETAYENGEDKLAKVLAVVESFTEDWDENWDDLVDAVTTFINTIVEAANLFGLDLSTLSDLFSGSDEDTDAAEADET